MALGAEVVDLVRLDDAQDAVQGRRVVQVAVVEDEVPLRHVRVLVEVVEPLGVEGGGAPDDPVDLVALREEQLGEIAAVLTRDPGDEARASRRHPMLSRRSESPREVRGNRRRFPDHEKRRARAFWARALQISRQRPTLPHSFPCSTIGSEGLNGRVRNGNGWSPLDMATGNSISSSVQNRVASCSCEVFDDSRLKNFMAKPHGRLVPVSFAPRSASTPGLSTWSSPTVLQGACAPGKSDLGVGFTLICLQRLSYRTPLPGVCRWRDNRCTGGSSNPVLSY